MFILDRPGSDKPTLIFLKKKLYDGPFKGSLALKILPAYWDKVTERAATTGLDRETTNEHKSINTVLSKIEQFINARTIEARHTGQHLTCAEMLATLIEVTGKTTAPKRGTSFFQQCEAIIGDMKSGKILTSQGKRYSAGTLKNYNNYLVTFLEYDAGLTWAGIDLDFYRSFIKWCNDKDHSLNYIGQHINKLIVLMKEAKRRGHHNNTAHLNDEFKRLKEDTDDISLSPEELDKIYNAKLPVHRLDVTRDWFIIACYLGLRVSDIQLLDDHNIEKGRVTIANEKTDTKVVIPLRPEVKAILKKWKGLPPKVTDAEINRTIKDICQLLNIEETVLYFLTKGGQRRDFYLKKYEMVSCHTARRCFITGLLNSGVPDNQVMQLAGIKKHATLLRYKKTKPEETADILQGHAFFKGASKPVSKGQADKR